MLGNVQARPTVIPPSAHASGQTPSTSQGLGTTILNKLVDAGNDLKGKVKVDDTFRVTKAFQDIKDRITTHENGDWKKLSRQDTDSLNSSLAAVPAGPRRAFVDILARGLGPGVLPSAFTNTTLEHSASEELKNGMREFANQWKTKFEGGDSTTSKIFAVVKSAAKSLKDNVKGKDNFDSAMQDIIENHCENIASLRTAVNDLFEKHGQDVFSANLEDGKGISSKFLPIAMLAIALNADKEIVADEKGNAVLQEQPSAPAVSLADVALVESNLNPQLAQLLEASASPPPPAVNEQVQSTDSGTGPQTTVSGRHGSVVINTSKLDSVAVEAHTAAIQELQTIRGQRQSVVAQSPNMLAIAIAPEDDKS
jgi:hypothetical protein